MAWESCAILHFTHYIRNVTQYHKTILSLNNEFTPTNTCEHPSYCLLLSPIFPSLLPYDLSHILFDMRWGIGAHVRKLVNYAFFPSNKFVSLSITHWYNAPSLTIDCQSTFRLLSANCPSNPIPIDISLIVKMRTLNCKAH